MILPYIWAVAPPPPDGTLPGTPAPLGNPGPVALDFNSVEGDWNVKDFNGIKGLDLKVTAEIVPLDHPYTNTTDSVTAGSIASNPSLTDDFGPSSADYPLNASSPRRCWKRTTTSPP